MNDAIILGIVGIIAISGMSVVAIIKPNGADRLNQAITTVGLITSFAFGVGLS